MLGITLALLAAAASGLSVVIVGRHIQRSNSFNVSILISAVGLVILWQVSVITPLLSIKPLFVMLLAFLYLRGTDHLSPKLVASIILIGLRSDSRHHRILRKKATLLAKKQYVYTSL
jgi:drug/metabolite transporter (DMT)-like permease